MKFPTSQLHHHYHHQSLNREGRWGTTDDFATSFLYFFPRIFDDAPVACLTPPSWCTAEGAVLADPGDDRSGMVWLLVFITWRAAGKVQSDGDIPVQVEHVAVEFVMEPFRPSGPFLRTMKISAQ